MADCTRPDCGHPEGIHDSLGFCLAEDCECRGFLHPDDVLLDDGPFVLEDEDEEELAGPAPLDFEEEE